MTSRDDTGTRSLSIANQYRDKGGLVYEFKGGAERLTVFIISRANDQEPDAWRVDLWSGTADPPLRVTGWGPTRAAALAAAVVSWTALPGSAVPLVDWKAVTASLEVVRAIEAR
jgi:hypothetical protein